MNKLTISLTTFGLTALILATPIAVFAQTVTPSAAVRSTLKTARLSTVNTRCQSAVSQRVTDLNSVTTRINALVRLSSIQKTQYAGEVATDVSALQGLQTQCTTDFNAGNATALTTDYKNVFLQYRVYAEFCRRFTY